MQLIVSTGAGGENQLADFTEKLPTLTWWFKVTFLGWLSDPFKGLSDLQLGDQKVTLNHLESIHSTSWIAKQFHGILDSFKYLTHFDPFWHCGIAKSSWQQVTSPKTKYPFAPNGQCLPMTPADKNYHFEAFGIPRKSSHHKFHWYGWTEGFEQPWGCTQVSSNFQSQVIASSDSFHPISAFLAKLGHQTHPMREACQLHCIGIHEICLWVPLRERGSKRIPHIELHVCSKAFQNNQSQFDSTQPPALSPLTFGSLNVWWHYDSFNASGFCLIHWLFSTSLWVWARLIYNSPVGIMAGIMSHSQATARIRTHSMTTFEYWAYLPKHPSIITSSP